MSQGPTECPITSAVVDNLLAIHIQNLTLLAKGKLKTEQSKFVKQLLIQLQDNGSVEFKSATRNCLIHVVQKDNTQNVLVALSGFQEDYNPDPKTNLQKIAEKIEGNINAGNQEFSVTFRIVPFCNREDRKCFHTDVTCQSMPIMTPCVNGDTRKLELFRKILSTLQELGVQGTLDALGETSVKPIAQNLRKAWGIVKDFDNKQLGAVVTTIMRINGISSSDVVWNKDFVWCETDKEDFGQTLSGVLEQDETKWEDKIDIELKKYDCSAEIRGCEFPAGWTLMKLSMDTTLPVEMTPDERACLQTIFQYVLDYKSLRHLRHRLGHCSEDNMLSYYASHPEFLKLAGEHSIFSIPIPRKIPAGRVKIRDFCETCKVGFVEELFHIGYARVGWVGFEKKREILQQMKKALSDKILPVSLQHSLAEHGLSGTYRELAKRLDVQISGGHLCLQGHTLLHFAVIQQKVEEAEMLINIDKVPLLEDNIGLTPYDYGLTLGTNRMLEKLLPIALKTSRNQIDGWLCHAPQDQLKALMGMPCITVASMTSTAFKKWSEVKLGWLVSLEGYAEVDINQRDEEGRTPLVHSIIRVKVAIAKMVMNHPNFDLRNNFNPDIYEWNLMHHLASTGNEELLQEVLLKFPTEESHVVLNMLRARNNDGFTPLALAANLGEEWGHNFTLLQQ